MIEQIMNSSNFNYLPRAMEAANIRHEVISHNIANVNTPGYKKNNLVFERLLAKEIYGEYDDVRGKRLQLVRTQDMHIPITHRHFVAKPTIINNPESIMRVDDNNVDIDIEMATLAKNQLYFNALATQMNGYVSKLKSAISSGQS